MKQPRASVYVIGPAEGPQKIGVAHDPEARRRALQVGNPDRLIVHSTREFMREAAYAVERGIRNDQASRRLHGDWYAIGPVEAAQLVHRAVPPRVPETASARIGAEWRRRLKATGLSQKDFAELLGVTPNTVSQALGGRWQSGVPQYMQATIALWEALAPRDRINLKVQVAALASQ